MTQLSMAASTPSPSRSPPSIKTDSQEPSKQKSSVSGFPSSQSSSLMQESGSMRVAPGGHSSPVPIRIRRQVPIARARLAIVYFFLAIVSRIGWRFLDTGINSAFSHNASPSIWCGPDPRVTPALLVRPRQSPPSSVASESRSFIIQLSREGTDSET